ncbi:GcrA family cell cycle regulator [Oceanomicrobium pacificus]|uniref:GcrA cell cycle regulator n=1 Tax=Oceanomicrobium pacificus TaxID=2692916 RepID=A0A6B0U119_9RHOB|nr:GcrA family cell cycle regulator [Oceanomicrobium pacificus]MXU66874.1 GcrA cell cycle regulator [Oceanomicrobium pacificus]
MSWTDERVEMLKTMWGEGKSASQIAKELGGVTRNAVIGKVHRLGLSNRASAPASKPTAKEPAKAAKPAPKEKAPAPQPAKEAPAAAAAPAAKPAPAKDAPRPRPVITAGQPLPPQPAQSEISEEARANLVEIEKKAKRLTLMQLTERTCKWPIGDPATEDFWFCGHPAQPGKPYCEAHVAVAFQPMSSRRDRRSGSR